MNYTPIDFPTGFDAEQLRQSLVAAHGDSFGLTTHARGILIADLLILQAGKTLPAVDATCRAHFAIDWNTAKATAAAAQASIDQATKIDATIATLKAMDNAGFDAWWAANVTNLPQASVVLKVLAKIVIRRLT